MKVKELKIQYDIEYRKKNPIKCKENKRKYYYENQKKCCEYSKKWVEENKERHKKNVKAYAEKNKEQLKEYKKQYRQENLKEILKKGAEYRKRIKSDPKLKKKEAEYKKKWAKENSAKCILNASWHRATKRNAILPSSDSNKINEILSECRAKTKRCKRKYHVDHIIPLHIGGAHHQDNLRIITALANLKKQGKYIPELGGVWADNELAKKNRRKYCK